MPGLSTGELYVKKENMPIKYSDIFPIKGTENRVANCYNSCYQQFIKNEQ
jgi:hypothetical protein